MAPQRHILLVARTLPWQIQGGMEQHAWNLARALHEEGALVRLLTTAFDHIRREESRDGIEITYLPHLPSDYENRAFWRRWGKFSRAALKEFRRDPQRYDLILSEMLHAWRIFRHPNARESLRCIIMHGGTAQDYRYDARPKMLATRSALHPRAIAQWLFIRGRLRRERRLFLPSADLVIAVSPWVAMHLRRDYGVPEEKIRIIGNGIAPPARLPARAEARRLLGLADGPWILYLGRLEEAKGPQRVLEAAATRPEWHVAIAGDGPLRSRLEDDARKNPNARILGRLNEEEKWRWLVAADALALPSTNEGQPITILEAVAAATPVATSRDWVPPELQDAIQIDADPARAIEGARQRQAAAGRLAPKSRELFTWRAVARGYLALERHL